SDFVFKTGNDNSPGGWATAPAPILVTVVPGDGTSGGDRVEIIWGANAVKNAWLEVEVLPTANTGLVATDVFYWGNLFGDSNLNFQTTGGDATQVLTNIGGDGSVTSRFDHNRNKSVTGGDAVVSLTNVGGLTRINLVAGAMSDGGGIDANPAAQSLG